MSPQTESGLLHKYKGILFSSMSSEGLLDSLDSFDARDDDIFLVSYPKSGTHWVAEVIENIPNIGITLTSPIEWGNVSKFEELEMVPKRRVIPTHLSYEMIPETVKQKQCKIVYVVRNPKDTAVSLFHYYRDNPSLPSPGTWAAFLELFLRGDVVYGSWFDHVLSWEKHKNDKNVLFLFYEEMKKDFVKSLNKIADFLGIDVNDSDVSKIARSTSFNEMKSNAVKENCEPSHTICALTSDRNLVFRKGVVGDWINYFTPKQRSVFDELFTEKMKHSAVGRCLKEYMNSDGK
ncbi:sulfotransferase 1C2-like [Arvicola amphibius]|uniref:sulfotransferase 1C2-like n=1 Tax=Arvicola amphibius TaxID=1047088 RepID=UPI0018E36D72|nr:sulfotransferase 1C2-like [Arvicola amphibius]